MNAAVCAPSALSSARSFSATRPRIQLLRVRCQTAQQAVKRQVECIAAPPRPIHGVSGRPGLEGTVEEAPQGDRIKRCTLVALERELDNGESIKALHRFNQNLRQLTAENWETKLRPVLHELAYNLESFNPAFTAVLLKVQSTIGYSDYVARDNALKNLIQPLAGEYGMHNGESQAKTHRELFSEFYEDLMDEPLAAVLSANPRPARSVTLFEQMMRDILSGGNVVDPVEQASYAMGYNLAIEYLADFEKTWMLESVRHLNKHVLSRQGRSLMEWLFLEVHAEDESVHAAIGHDAVLGFVPASHEHTLRHAMKDHDRDFSDFYNYLADLLE